MHKCFDCWKTTGKLCAPHKANIDLMEGPMIKIIYETDLPEGVQARIQHVSNFALEWYTDKFSVPITDLDTMRFSLYPLEGNQGVLGRANDGRDIDRVSVRDDLFVDGWFTDRGFVTLCHELLHFCQYATDFERRYDVPYAQRPQEVQAFAFADELANAYKLSLPIVEAEPEEIEDDDIPISVTPVLPSNNRSRNLRVLLIAGLVALSVLFLSGCAALQHSLPVTGAAGIGAGIGAAAGGPAGAVIGAAAAAATTEAVVPAIEPLSSNPVIAEKQLKYQTIERSIFALLILITGLVFYHMKNGRQRKYERMMFDDPNYTTKDLK